MVDIVGIGVSVWDSICLLESFPQRGAVVRAERFVQGIGGGITVAMAMASRLGASVALIDALGDDAVGNQIRETLRSESVETRWLQTIVGKTSSTASIWSETQEAERTIVFLPGTACDQIMIPNDLSDCIKGTKLLHLNGRHLAVCKQAVEIARQHGVLVSFDGGAFRYREETLPLLRAADIVIVARQYAESHYTAMTGKSAENHTGSELVRFLHDDLDCQIAAVTHGSRGSDFAVRGKINREAVSGVAPAYFFQSAINVDQAVDTTGCGDTFHGAFLAGIAAGGSIQACARLAAEVAGANARGIGGLFYNPPTLIQNFTSP
ncbi:carbohydrate kinase family protein [Roseiconus lacunae]|uniref:carbohydrate kinase family protein n=1 Tax=Roseiconus lacunae TaxID=2605694 RepID=UPI0011F13F93|nr:carbohydrate kinase family protein [Roseiconus lacunae]